MSKPLKELLSAWESATAYDDIEPSAEEMARRLRKLDKRHKPRTICGVPGDSCWAEDGAFSIWPCPDRRILDGEDE